MDDTYTPTRYSIRDEYAPLFGRERLTLWSGAFASTFEGHAWELPNHDGYMVTLDYLGSVRVECETPRTDENYDRVDAALSAAAQELARAAHARRIGAAS